MIKKARLGRRFAAAFAALGKFTAQKIDFGDLLFIAAVAAVGYGVAQIYWPAAWIIVGAIGIVVAIRTPGGEK